ncbi:MAG: ATP-dependent DNA helicase [Gammaproteobacteria bacterium]|nr:ATP-dependent DNA helicase [Gammaproteobacteria bacterium]NNC69048.1 ATP-dependent DNA helicase [Gammaproteobacteria bacterium]
MSAKEEAHSVENISKSIFSEKGLLFEYLENFRHRPQQQSMSNAVETALNNYSQLIVEAGTGVGKTFAYLIPALLSKQKVVISTGTKHLQDQLYFKDLPTILKIFKLPVKTALLKGRANYLCLYRLEHHGPNAQMHNRQLAKKINIIKEWSQFTKTGEIAEVTAIYENDMVWPNVTSTIDNCLGAECPSYDKCHVIKARQKAQQADVVIINHHLFFADLALKMEGFGELLPSANSVIFDEAHQLPELASTFLATSTSSRQMNDLASDVLAAHLEEAPEVKEIQPVVDALQKAVADFQLALSGKNGRFPWYEIISVSKIEDQFDALCKAVHELYEMIAPLGDRGKVLTKCVERCERIEQGLYLISEGNEERINWLECFERGFKLHSTPLVVADSFQEFMQQYKCSWIFTSATLTVNSKFDHFQQQLGLVDAETLMLDSPYDYQNNTRLYLPVIGVEPNDKNYTHKVIDAVLPILEANQGRAFLLFTSHRALRIAANYLADHEEFTLLVQGDSPRRELLSIFSKTDHAVLLGTSSFWEGVDIRGEALSCVVIDKLPFAAPDDPVLSGRLQALRQTGENPFMKYQLPQAVISLKQGVGRLIRDEEDYGVVVICDPRMLTKPYGKTFINSLPNMLRTSSLDDAINFLELRESEYEAVSH